MINLGTDKIKNIYMGVDGISKVYLGTDLIWEKVTFKDLNIIGFGEVTVNDGGEYQLPINVPLIFITSTPTLYSLKITGLEKSNQFINKNQPFIIKTNKPFKIKRDGIWDVTFKQSNEAPKKVIR